MAIKIIGIGCTEVIIIDVRDKLSGQPITSAQVTLRFFDAKTGQPLPDSEFTLQPVYNKPGLWRTIIPATFTNTLKNNEYYKIQISIQAANGDYLGEDRVLAKIMPIP
jgi:hypothetical protein